MSWIALGIMFSRPLQDVFKTSLIRLARKKTVMSWRLLKCVSESNQNLLGLGSSFVSVKKCGYMSLWLILNIKIHFETIYLSNCCLTSFFRTKAKDLSSQFTIATTIISVSFIFATQRKLSLNTVRKLSLKLSFNMYVGA